MFEQTFVRNTDASRKPLHLAASLTIQSAALAAALVVPLMQTAQITWKAPLILYSPPRLVPPAVQVQTNAASAAVAPFARPVYRPAYAAPTHVPDRIATDAGDIPAPAPEARSAGSFGYTLDLPFANSGLVKPPEPVVAPPKKLEAVRVSIGVQQAMLLYQVKPAYPPMARSARVSGTVRLTAVISTDGTIQKLQVIGGHPLLIKAASEAVRQWRYKPTLLSGQPVEVITEIDVNFTLSN